MLKKFYKKVTINFRQTKSERSANNSYRNYHQKVKKLFQNVNPFKKLKKEY